MKLIFWLTFKKWSFSFNLRLTESKWAICSLLIGKHCPRVDNGWMSVIQLNSVPLKGKNVHAYRWTLKEIDFIL